MPKSRRAIIVEDWPAQDRIAWEQAMNEGGLWEDSGAGARWSRSHRDHVAWDYGRWLGYLQSIDALDNCKPASRVNRQRVNDYIQTLRASVGSRAVANYIKGLSDALRIMGCVKDLDWLREINASLQRQIQPAIPKRPRLRDSKDLYQLGICLMKEARDKVDARLRSAIQYRDGLLIALLACRPLRRRTLASIRIGRQLVETDGKWWLVFATEDVKQGRPIEYEWPEALITWLEEYLNNFRPRFGNAQGHNALWASKKGKAMCGVAINARVCHHTRQAFGKPISIHLFRDCAATTVAQRDPGHVGIARELLGHSRLDTTHRYYIQAGSLEASRMHAKAIQERRKRHPMTSVETE